MIVECPIAVVVDGDTLRCGSERLRLLGIDAPEIEHCPRWRQCAPGDGLASKRSLGAALRLGPLRYHCHEGPLRPPGRNCLGGPGQSLLLAAPAGPGDLQAEMG